MNAQIGSIIINKDGSISIDLNNGSHIRNQDPEGIKNFLEIELKRIKSS